MSKIYNILVESAKRSNGTASDFTLTLLWSLSSPKTIALESVQLFNSQYTINNNNNKLYWTDSTATTITSTLTKGNYTATSLAAMIQTVMNADNTGADTYTVVFSTVTGKMAITNTSGNNFALNYATTTTSCATTTGFLKTDKTGASTYIGDNVVSLNTKLYKIYLDFLGSNTYSANQVTGLIAIVPNNVSFGDMIAYNPPLAKSFVLKNVNDISTFKVTIRDDTDTVVDLNGVDWTMNLCVSV
jgi:hypothetical protein